MKTSEIVVRGVFLMFAFVAAAATAQASNYSNAVQAPNPIDYWQFAGPTTAGSTSIDQGSNGVAGNGTYNGTVTSGGGIPTATYRGFVGGNQSIAFGGAGSITGSDAGEINSNNARTITAWVNTTTNDSSYHDIFYYGTATTNEAIFTLVPPAPNANDSNFPGTGGNFGASAYGNGVGTTDKINDGNWHFVAFTITPNGAGNATYDLYVDGALEATKSLGTNTVLGGTYYIGTDALSLSYSGQLAQEAIFNTALTGSQIAGLFAAAVDVPEPSSIVALGGIGVVAMLLAASRRRRGQRCARRARLE